MGLIFAHYKDKRMFRLHLDIDGLSELQKKRRVESSSSIFCEDSSKRADNAWLAYENRKDQEIFGATSEIIDSLKRGDERYFDVLGKPNYGAVIAIAD